jgi:hypothetical protein
LLNAVATQPGKADFEIDPGLYTSVV